MSKNSYFLLQKRKMADQNKESFVEEAKLSQCHERERTHLVVPNVVVSGKKS